MCICAKGDAVEGEEAAKRALLAGWEVAGWWQLSRPTFALSKIMDAPDAAGQGEEVSVVGAYPLPKK